MMKLKNTNTIHSQIPVAFKRNLLKKIEKHPSIWATSAEVDKSYSWKEVERELDYAYSKRTLESIWAYLRHRYYRKIFLRTIERNFEAPNWVYFHDMAFLYNNVKEIIQKKLGGISPPLFKPRPFDADSPRFICPCCMHIEPVLESNNILKSVGTKKRSHLKTNNTPSSKIIENDKEEYDNSDSEDLQSVCSLYFEDELDLISNSADFSEHQQSESEYSVHNSEKTNSELCEVIEIIDDADLTEEESSKSQQDHVLAVENIISQNLSNEKNINENLEHHLQETENPTTSNTTNVLVERQNSPQSIKTTRRLETVVPNNTNAKQTKYESRAIERSKIIACIKGFPCLYANDQARPYDKHQAWLKVEKIVGLPRRIIKNRWKQITNRYLKELVIQRYSVGIIRSYWECFDEMEFMYPYMQKEIQEIDETRSKMQDAIKKSSVLTLEQEHSKLISTLAKLKEINPNSVPICREIPLKTYSKKSRPSTQPDVLDPKTIPILQNRPIKVTAVKVYPPLDLTVEDDPEHDSTTNDHPPSKKLRLSSDQEKIDENTDKFPIRVRKMSSMISSAIDSIYEENIKLSSPSPNTEQPPILSPNPDLPATPVQAETQLSSEEPQIVFPSFDLTMDEDLCDEKSECNINSNLQYQQAFENEFVNTNKVFPSLDLTADEVEVRDDLKEQDTSDDKVEKKQEEEGDDDVICLDDNESVGSYEEVIVFVSEDPNVTEK